jgi:hypothetical protein
VAIVLKSGSLKLLAPSGPVEACNGIALRMNEISDSGVDNEVGRN